MSYGLQVWNAAGVLTFDSLVAVGGVFLGAKIIPEGSPAGSEVYSGADIAGRTLLCIEVGAGTFNWTTDTVGNQPRLNWTPRPSPGSGVTGLSGDAILLVFAR
jgi:hypothetical protein